MPDLLRIVQRSIALLRDLEWSSYIWTDTACCPSCGAVRDGLPANDHLPAEPPRTHRDGCELFSLLQDAMSEAIISAQ